MLKFWLASMKTLTNFKNPSNNHPLQSGCCAAFRKPPVTVKLAPEPGCDSENCSESSLYDMHVYRLWGLRNMTTLWVYDIMTTGLVYPLFEHVDIFPVRLVPTFHWVFSVYLILAIYLHSRPYPCGRNKRQGLDPFLIKYKDSLHIHKWHGTFYYRDTTTYIITIPSSPCNNVVWCSGD